MKILFLSTRGIGLGVANRLQQEGHEVLTYIHDENATLSGDGYLHKISSWRTYLSDVNLVICDEPGFGARAADLRGNGRPVLGCDALADVNELEPQKQLQLLEACELPYPDTAFWFSDNRSILPTFKRCFVRVWVGQGRAYSGLIETVRDWEWLLSTLNNQAMLITQDPAPGVECNVVGLWNGRSFLNPTFLTFEQRRPMNGDLGPLGDCSGLVMRALSEGSRIHTETMGKLEGVLKRLAYRGMVTARVCIDGDNLLVLGVRIGFSHDAMDALGAVLYEDSLGDALFDCAIGVNRTLKTTRDYTACIRLTVPPYPYADAERVRRGAPVHGLDEKTLPWVNLVDVYKLSGGPAFAAGSGVVAKVLAHGRSAAEACGRAYRTLQNVHTLDGQYRTDIGANVPVAYEALKSSGWVT